MTRLLLLALFATGCLCGPLIGRDATLYGVIPADATGAGLPDGSDEGGGQTFVPLGTDGQGRATYREEASGIDTDPLGTSTFAYSYQATLVEGTDGYVFSLAPTAAPQDDSGLLIGIYESCSLVDASDGVCIAVQTEGVSGQPDESGTAMTITYSGIVSQFTTIGGGNQAAPSQSPTAAPSGSSTATQGGPTASASAAQSAAKRVPVQPLTVVVVSAAAAFSLAFAFVA